MIITKKRLSKLLKSYLVEAVSSATFKKSGSLLDAGDKTSLIKKGAFKISGKLIKQKTSIYAQLSDPLKSAWLITSPFLPVNTKIINVDNKEKSFSVISKNSDHVLATLAYVSDSKDLPVKYDLIKKEGEKITVKINEFSKSNISTSKVKAEVNKLKTLLGQGEKDNK